MANKRFCFTLSEVLITLVVIGVIAAIAVPMIMENHRKLEAVSKIKKVYSTVINAVNLVEINNGIRFCPRFYYTGDIEWYPTTEDIFEKYVLPYINATRTEKNRAYECISGKGSTCTFRHQYILNDGTIVDASSHGLTFDINGDKGPNSSGRDIFYVPLNKCYNEDLLKKDRDYLLNMCKEGRTNRHIFCTFLIIHDGYEIKSDYPWRI